MKLVLDVRYGTCSEDLARCVNLQHTPYIYMLLDTAEQGLWYTDRRTTVLSQIHYEGISLDHHHQVCCIDRRGHHD